MMQKESVLTWQKVRKNDTDSEFKSGGGQDM